MKSELIDLVKWIAGVSAWLFSLYVTYRVGRQSKIDEIHIRKRHEMAEELAAALKKDFHERKILADLYNKNFGHLKNLSDASDAFSRYESMYSGMRELMTRLPDGVNKLEELARRGSIYFREQLVSDFEQYISLTRFSYTGDGTGGLLFNTYFQSFFGNLLEKAKTAERERLQKRIVSSLRKALR